MVQTLSLVKVWPQRTRVSCHSRSARVPAPFLGLQPFMVDKAFFYWNSNESQVIAYKFKIKNISIILTTTLGFILTKIWEIQKLDRGYKSFGGHHIQNVKANDPIFAWVPHLYICFKDGIKKNCKKKSDGQYLEGGLKQPPPNL